MSTSLIPVYDRSSGISSISTTEPMSNKNRFFTASKLFMSSLTFVLGLHFTSPIHSRKCLLQLFGNAIAPPLASRRAIFASDDAFSNTNRNSYVNYGSVLTKGFQVGSNLL